MTAEGSESLRIYTIGHSDRSLEEFIGLLQGADVAILADVRTVPRSRHVPQFNREELERALPQSGIQYVHLAALGGLRRGMGSASPNTAWRNASFRGFADYMLTSEFEAGLGELLRLAREDTTAIMCAEAVPWRCHRSLIADALMVRGIEVVHVMGRGRLQPHHLTPFARVTGTRVLYPEGAGAAPQVQDGRQA